LKVGHRMEVEVKGPKLPGQQEIILYEDNSAPQGIVLDALPYIDPERSAELIRQVKLMVEEEMKSFEPIDYLAHLPLPETTMLNSELIRNEFDRIREGKDFKSLDSSRYAVRGPTAAQLRPLSGANREEVWRQETENAWSRIAEEDEKIINLELMKRFGPLQWQKYSEDMTQIEAWINGEVNKVREAKDNINRKRAYEQTKKKPELEQLETEWWSLVTRNNETQLAIELAERKVKRMKLTAQKRGLI